MFVKQAYLALCTRSAGAVLIAPVRTAKLPMRVLHIDPKSAATVGIGGRGRPKTTCMPNYHALFLAFLNIYTNIALLSRKYLFALYFYQYFPILNNCTANRLRRSGKAMSPPALAGVATRRFAHFLTSPERSVSRVQRHSTAKKNSRPTRHLLFIPRRKSKSISTGLRHKPQMPRFPS